MPRPEPAPATPPDLPTLTLDGSLADLPPAALEAALQGWLPSRRWYPGTRADAARLLYLLPCGDVELPAVLAEVEVPGDPASYPVPLVFVPLEQAAGASDALRGAVARLRLDGRDGVLMEGFGVPAFITRWLDDLAREPVRAVAGGELHWLPVAAAGALPGCQGAPVKVLSAEQSNSSAVIDGRYMFKLLRRVLPGLHPEAEMGAYLTAQGFAHVPALLGQVRRVDADGAARTLAVLQAFRPNQGDAWQWTLEHLDRALRNALAADAGGEQAAETELRTLQAFAGVLGRRLGELHSVLARPADEADFGPLESDAATTEAWARSVVAQLDAALAALEDHRAALDPETAALAAGLLQRRDALRQQVETLARRSAGGLLIRVHGDLHLGQVLVEDGDACFIDFEGEPTRSLAERRARHSPFKDVAGLLRSFDYAAAMLVRGDGVADDAPQAAALRRQLAERYRQQAGRACLEAYRIAAAGLPHAWFERDGEQAALALFGIEKAAYEILYEAHYRPHWLAVPLRGLVALTQDPGVTHE